MSSTTIEILVEAVEKRATRRGLFADLERIRYANGYLYDEAQNPKPSSTLYVGVGHGHDALLALIDQLTGTITGVDPFIGGHGNDDQDYDTLLQTIAALSLVDHFKVERCTVQSYLDENTNSFDQIICNDVLHHIFEESVPLAQSDAFEAAVELFRQFRAAIRPGGSLVISDAGRHGLRQFVHHSGLAKLFSKTAFTYRGSYKNKQPWQQWNSALTQAGWHQRSLRNYIPFPLRKYSEPLSGLFGRYTFCDHYVLSYSRDG